MKIAGASPPSPAEFFLPPAAGGVQALPMNSLRSAWTPVLAGRTQTDKQAKGVFEALSVGVILSIELVQNIGLVKLTTKTFENPPHRETPRIETACRGI